MHWHLPGDILIGVPGGRIYFLEALLFPESIQIIPKTRPGRNDEMARA
jgi:hypothetical protein